MKPPCTNVHNKDMKKTWGFHAHLTIGNHKILICNNIINLFTHETPMGVGFLNF
jgi:hypothetical protein